MERYSSFSLDAIAARLSDGAKKQHLNMLRSRFLPEEEAALAVNNPKKYEELIEQESNLPSQLTSQASVIERSISDFVKFVSSDEPDPHYWGARVPQKAHGWTVNRTSVLRDGSRIRPDMEAKLEAKGKSPFIDWTNDNLITELFVARDLPPPYNNITGGFYSDNKGGVYQGGLVQWFLDNRKFDDRLSGVALESLDYEELSSLYSDIGLSDRMIRSLQEEMGITTVVEGQDYQVLEITTTEAAHKYCYGFGFLDWCVKDEHHAQDYLLHSPLYVIILEGKTKQHFMFSPAYPELKDEKNLTADPLKVNAATDGFVKKKVFEHFDDLIERAKKSPGVSLSALSFLTHFWNDAGSPQPWKPFERLLNELTEVPDPYPLLALYKNGYDLDVSHHAQVLAGSYTDADEDFKKNYPQMGQPIFRAVFTPWEDLQEDPPWPPLQELLKDESFVNGMSPGQVSDLMLQYVSLLPEEDLKEISERALGALIKKIMDAGNGSILTFTLEWLLDNPDFLLDRYESLTKMNYRFPLTSLRFVAKRAFPSQITKPDIDEFDSEVAKDVFLGMARNTSSPSLKKFLYLIDEDNTIDYDEVEQALEDNNISW
jgi:hypothetical protein